VPSAHFWLEALAYGTAFQLYLLLRRRRGDALESRARWSVFVAAAIGAALGSKLLGLLQDPAELGARLSDPRAFFGGGKTIVGALLGGWIAVEWVKRRAGVTRRTGDLFALPLCVGIAIGRVGCWLAGPADRTHGLPTRLAWGVDAGDGVPRHPVLQAELIWLAVLALVLRVAHARDAREGVPFRIFLAGYLGFRLVVDVLKAGPTLLGFTAIQWGCAGGLSLIAIGWPRSVPAPAAREVTSAS
jgi:prolipoprotein diacylglyceryltransferase